jgi:hypothetical protein
LATCRQNDPEWHPGQVDYPKSLTLPLNEAKSYVAAVDIRSTPPPATTVLPLGPTGQAPIAVKCALGARLVTPPDNSLAASNTDWNVREFTPTGVVNWSWSITALRPGDHDIQLELEPVLVTSANGVPVGSGTADTATTFLTPVHVDTFWFEAASFWWKDNWPSIALICGGIGAAILALIKWGGSLGETIRQAMGKWRGDPAESKPDTVLPSPKEKAHPMKHHTGQRSGRKR